jgi:hypothetical protein
MESMDAQAKLVAAWPEGRVDRDTQAVRDELGRHLGAGDPDEQRGAPPHQREQERQYEPDGPVRAEVGKPDEDRVEPPGSMKDGPPL